MLEKLSSSADFLKHVALFTERYQKVHLEEPIAPSALFGIFESTFSHHPAFSPSLGRFYETNPDWKKHTVANLVAHITPSIPYIQKLASLPMQLSVLWVFTSSRLLLLQLFPLPLIPKPPLKRRLGKRSRRNSLPHNTLLCWPI